MTLDLYLTKLGLKLKHLVVLDVNFEGELLKDFSSAYPHRYLYLPSHGAMILEMAVGMASLGKLVLVIGSELKEATLPDSTLNVKLVMRDKKGTWDGFEEGVRAFGVGVLLLPEEE